MPNGAVYSATKAAVDAITQSLAQELGAQGIRVNSLQPGVTATEGFRAMADNKDFEALALNRTPLGRTGCSNGYCGRGAVPGYGGFRVGDRRGDSGERGNPAVMSPNPV